ncbi:MAG TPA: lipase family protein [Verrucomicrobiae bacterium]|jgi:hypothetical protein|nr:lipase family protein [Verrucomicrobiae bacterium]
MTQTDASFDIGLGVALLAASAAAYAPPAAATVAVSEATDTHVMMGNCGPDGTLAFRGTVDWKNWRTDLDCEKVAWDAVHPECKVHRGFLTAWLAVRDQVRDWVEKAGPATRAIYLTGHSLGGALAMLAAADMRTWPGVQMRGCYTFGQPRVGGAAFRDFYNATLRSRTFRVVHADDVVPRIPWLLGAYRHAGTEVFFPSFGTAPLVNPPWWLKAPSDLIGVWREGRAAWREDHAVQAYVRALARAPGAETPISTARARV